MRPCAECPRQALEVDALTHGNGTIYFDTWQTEQSVDQRTARVGKNNRAQVVTIPLEYRFPAGMRPITYASAEEFRAAVKPPRFDCLVLDVHLPGMSGLDLRNRLVAEGVATPVLFVTAHDDPRVREQAMAGRCAGFFQKTDAGGEILDAIRRAVAPPKIR